jgi:hypothetical protein
MTSQTFSASGTWPVPSTADPSSIQVYAWGEGGSGGIASHGFASGGGGGGGAFGGEPALGGLTPGSTTLTITIGTGGTGTDTTVTGGSVTVTGAHGANGSGATGGTGGAAGSNTIALKGGNGGGGGGSTTPGAGGGGSGGSAGVGGAGTAGGAGGAGGTAGSGAAGPPSLAGATGAAGTGFNSSGANGIAPGSGASGGGGGGTFSHTGGTGAAGQVVIIWTTSTAITEADAAGAAEALTAQATSIPPAVIAAPPRPAGPPPPPLRAQILLVPAGTAAPRDAAAAAEALAVTSITVTLADAGGAVDYPTNQALQGDTAGASETLAVSAAIPLPDTTGAAADAHIPSAQVALTDAGAQTDVGQTTGLSQSETAGAADRISVAATGIALSDVAAAAEAIGSATAIGASGGASSPQAYPGTSQVAVAAPGSSTWYYLGSYGTVTALTYSFVMPGGADKMTATLAVPASYRNQILNPGWKVRITRGGHIVWTGKMDEPQPGASGWSLTAVGDGNRGTDFLAIYSSTWPAGQPDQSINNAVARGLPWVNAGVGTPTGAWYGQAVDNGAQTITQLLNLICTRGGLVWYADSQPGGQPGTDLHVFPLPSQVNRLLVATGPVGRTLGGDINTIYLRYQATADDTSSGGTGAATYAITVVTNSASIAAHGNLETFVDLSDAGVMSASQAQQVGGYVMSIYQRASFTGPLTARHGQLLNAGGAAVDPGTDQAGTVCRLLLSDFGQGGEVVQSQQSLQFLVGAYIWDDFSLTATLSPYQSVNLSLTGLLGLENTILQPVTASG